MNPIFNAVIRATVTTSAGTATFVEGGSAPGTPVAALNADTNVALTLTVTIHDGG